MKLAMKVLATAVVLAATHNAFATMAISTDPADSPNGTGSELLFWVQYVNPASGNVSSYVRDLGVRVTNFVPGGASVPTSGYTYDILTAAPNGSNSFPGLYASTPPGVNDAGYNVHWSDSSLVNFFGSTNFTSPDTTWGVMAASAVAGGSRSLVTSNDPAVLAATNSDGQNIKGNVDTFIGSFNASPTASGTVIRQNVAQTSTTLSDAYNVGNLLGSLSLTFTTGANVGTPESFYSIANGASGAIQNIYAGMWSLNSDGLLTYQVAAVPEASTWAMFGAGLLLVGAIARRRLS